MASRRSLVVVLAAISLLAPTESLFASAQAERQAVQPAGPVVIDWLGYSTFAQPDSGTEIQKRVEAKYNARFNIWYVDKQKYDEALGIKLAGGDMPDFMLMFNPSNASRYVEQGVLAAITEAIFARLPNYRRIIKEIDPDNTIFNDVMVDGKIYALKSAELGTSYPTAVVWRTDWLRNVGLARMPETLDEFTIAAYKFANEDPDRNGKKDTYAFSDSAIEIVLGAFGPVPMYRYSSRSGQRLHWSQRDGRLVFNAIQPEMKEGLAYLQKLYKDGIIDPEFVTSENKGGYWAIPHAFLNNRIGLTARQYYYHWAPPLTKNDKGGQVYLEMIKANPGSEFGKTFELGKPPIGPKGKSGAFATGAASIDNWSFTTKGVKEPRKLDVITRMIEDNLSDFDHNTLVNWGLSGVHHTIDEDGVYTLTPAFTGTPERIRAGLGVFAGGPRSPEFDKRRNPKLYAFGDKYRTTGYVPAAVPATAAYQKYIGDLTKLSTEAYIAIITGAKPIEYFDEYVRTFRSRGGDEIEKEVNETVRKMTGR